MTQTAALEGGIRDLAVDLIDESPSNPRKLFRGLDELAGDIARRGVLQPILVRPRDQGRFEVVFGARRLRASRLAERATIPAVVQDLDDRQVLETQVVENQQREDVHPLEEADAYRALHEVHQVVVDEIAARVGKSRAYVYGRLKLCALCEAARLPFLEGKVSASIALLVARIHSPERQAMAIGEILDGGFDHEEAMSFREAKEHIERSYMLELKGAPFILSDGELVPSAGPCSTCPKRSGNQLELLGEAGRADVCTDPGCYRTKCDTVWSRRVADAEIHGHQVLSDKDGERLFPYGRLNWNSGYVELDAACDLDPKRRHWRRLIGKTKPPICHVRDSQGRPHELVREKDARETLRAAGHRFGTPAAKAAQEEAPYEQKLRFEKALERVIRSRITDAAVRRVSTRGLKLQDWRAIARAMVMISWSDTTRAIAARRSLDDTGSRKHDTVGALVKWVDAASEGEARGLIVELALARAHQDVDFVNGDEDDDWDEEIEGPRWTLTQAGQLWGFDVEKIRVRALADVTAYVGAVAAKRDRKEPSPATPAAAKPARKTAAAAKAGKGGTPRKKAAHR